MNKSSQNVRKRRRKGKNESEKQQDRVEGNGERENVEIKKEDYKKPVLEDAAEVKISQSRARSQYEDALPPSHQSTLRDETYLKMGQIDLSELKAIWESWSQTTQDNFRVRYGNIASLSFVHVHVEVLRAMLQFWDPSYRCFVFNEVDMAPTIEEYSALIGSYLPRPDPWKTYWKYPKVQHIQILGRMMGEESETVGKYIQTKESSKGVAWTFIRDKIFSEGESEKAMRLYALAVYGLVLFPRIQGYIEMTVIDLFSQMDHGCDPVSAVVAETFRSLTICRKGKKKRFVGCSQLLYVWFRSHFPPAVNAFKGSGAAVDIPSQFRRTQWTIHETKGEWMKRLSQLKSEDVQWLAPWMWRAQMLYRCGSHNSVPLIGLWGATNYVPTMFRRQLGCEQFIPATHELSNPDFTFDYAQVETGLVTKVVELCKSWRKRFMISNDEMENQVDEKYPEWQYSRGKDVNAPKYVVMAPLSWVWDEGDKEDLEIANEKLKGENFRLMVAKKENIKMIEDLTAQLKESEDENCSLKKGLQKAREWGQLAIADKATNQILLRGMEEKLKAIRRLLKKEMEKHQNTIRNLNTHKQVCRELGRIKREADCERDEAKTKKDRAKNKIDQFRAQQKSLEAKLKNEQEKSRKLELEMRDFREKNVILEAQKTALEAQNGSLQAEKERIQIELQRALAIIEGLNEQINDLEAAKTEITEQLATRTRECDNERREKEEARANLAGATAWRDFNYYRKWSYGLRALEQEGRANYWEERTRRAITIATSLITKLKKVREGLALTEANRHLEALINEAILKYNEVVEMFQE